MQVLVTYIQKEFLNEARLALGLKAKRFFESLYNAKIKKKKIENPIPSKVFELPKYTQIKNYLNMVNRYRKKLVYG